MTKLWNATLSTEEKGIVDTKIIELDTHEKAVEFAKEMFKGFGYNLDDYILDVKETSYYP